VNRSNSLTDDSIEMDNKKARKLNQNREGRDTMSDFALGDEMTQAINN